MGVDHHAEIDDLVVGAPEHHADDVLADVVHVAFDRGEHNGALRRLACGSDSCGLRSASMKGVR